MTLKETKNKEEKSEKKKERKNRVKKTVRHQKSDQIKKRITKTKKRKIVDPFWKATNAVKQQTQREITTYLAKAYSSAEVLFDRFSDTFLLIRGVVTNHISSSAMSDFDQWHFHGSWRRIILSLAITVFGHIQVWQDKSLIFLWCHSWDGKSL